LLVGERDFSISFVYPIEIVYRPRAPVRARIDYTHYTKELTVAYASFVRGSKVDDMNDFVRVLYMEKGAAKWAKFSLDLRLSLRLKEPHFS